MSGTKRRTTFWLLLSTVIISGGTAVAWGWNDGGEPSVEAPTYTVTRGPLVISVRESGNLDPLEELVIRSEVKGRPTILSLIPEGTMVTAGEVLIRLDASELRERHSEELTRVQNDEAAFIEAREGLAVTRSQAESDIARAETDLQFAKQDLARYLEGEYPNQVRKAESDITLAQERLKRAEDKQKWSQKLADERYISTTELQGDMLEAQRARLELQLAKDALALLKKHTHQRRLTELKNEIEQRRQALERVQRKVAADIVKAEANLQARESALERQKEKLGELKDQIAKTVIRAPRAGQVIYASSKSDRRRSDPLEEGQQVRERQELIVLPTDAGMRVETSVHESQVSMVEPGQTARIDVDALPGRRYQGEVASVAPLPDSNHHLQRRGINVYETEIHLTENDPALRTGMSCMVEIIVRSYADVLQVPVQAIVRHGEKPVAYVRDAQGNAHPRALALGNDNGKLVAVYAGLVVGEEVLLTPPLDAPAGLDQLEIPTKPTEAAPSTPPNTPSGEAISSTDPYLVPDTPLATAGERSSALP